MTETWIYTTDRMSSVWSAASQCVLIVKSCQNCSHWNIEDSFVTPYSYSTRINITHDGNRNGWRGWFLILIIKFKTPLTLLIKRITECDHFRGIKTRRGSGEVCPLGKWEMNPLLAQWIVKFFQWPAKEIRGGGWGTPNSLDSIPMV